MAVLNNASLVLVGIRFLSLKYPNTLTALFAKSVDMLVKSKIIVYSYSQQFKRTCRFNSS